MSSPAHDAPPSWQLAIAELERVLEEARAVARRAEASLLQALREARPANAPDVDRFSATRSR